MVILISEEYSSIVDKICDNLDFSIWVILFSFFLICFGVVIGFFFNWILCCVVVIFALLYLWYLFKKLGYITEKISVTNYGIHSQRVFLASKFKRGTGYGNSDDFYVVFSDILSFKFKGNNLMIKNKNSSMYDDLNYRFSNLSDENIVKIREILLERNISEIN